MKRIKSTGSEFNGQITKEAYRRGLLHTPPFRNLNRAVIVSGSLFLIGGVFLAVFAIANLGN